MAEITTEISEIRELIAKSLKDRKPLLIDHIEHIDVEKYYADIERRNKRNGRR